MGGSILLAKRGSKVMAIDRWPHLRDRTSATLRATMSVPPPGAYPTMSVTGRVGNSLACATGKNDKSADHKPRDKLTINFISFPSSGCLQIGRAHVRTPVTNAHLVCSLRL